VESNEYPAIMIFEARTVVLDAATSKELASVKWMVTHNYTRPGVGESRFTSL
jgi:hypothetical protein